MSVYNTQLQGNNANLEEILLRLDNLPNNGAMEDAIISKRDAFNYINNRVGEIGSYIFYYSPIVSAQFDSCETIWEYAFYNCLQLNNILIPSCKTISRSSFEYCQSLQSITLPNCSVIGERAFYGCQRLTSLYLPGSTIAELGSDALEGTLIDSGEGKIYVPSSLVASYKTTGKWVNYMSKIQPI